MALAPAITDLEQLKDRPEVARLLASNAGAVGGAKFDRSELTIWVDRTFLREACSTLRDDPPVRKMPEAQLVDAVTPVTVVPVLPLITMPWLRNR